MDSLKKLAELNTEAQEYGAKFEAGNKSAGTRLMGVLLHINKLTKEMRKEVSEKKNA